MVTVSLRYSGSVTSANGYSGYFTGGKGVFASKLCIGNKNACKDKWEPTVTFFTDQHPGTHDVCMLARMWGDHDHHHECNIYLQGTNTWYMGRDRASCTAICLDW